MYAKFLESIVLSHPQHLQNIRTTTFWREYKMRSNPVMLALNGTHAAAVVARNNNQSKCARKYGLHRLGPSSGLLRTVRTVNNHITVLVHNCHPTLPMKLR